MPKLKSLLNFNICHMLLNLDYRSSITRLTWCFLMLTVLMCWFVNPYLTLNNVLLKSGNGILSAIVNSLHFMSSHTYYNKWLNVLY